MLSYRAWTLSRRLTLRGASSQANRAWFYPDSVDNMTFESLVALFSYYYLFRVSPRDRNELKKRVNV